MIVSYNEYSSVSHYDKDRKSKTSLSSGSTIYPVNPFRLFRSSVIVGLAPKNFRKLPPAVRDWKMRTVKTFIDLNSKKPPLKFANFKDLETSERAAVSYLLGMIFAHLLMQNKYKIRHIEHLNNSGIHPVRYPNTRKSPDFWGFDRTIWPPTDSYLVEAKGSLTPDEYIAMRPINKAVKQLNSIKQIGYKTSMGRSLIFNKDYLKNLDKLIIATHPNSNNNVIQKIIDPEESEELVITINGDESIFNYYYNLIGWLQSANSREVSIEINHNEKNFVITDIPDTNISVGVLKEIYERLNRIVEDEKRYEIEDFNEIDQDINKELDELIAIDNEIGNISLGIDGVIALDKNLKGNKFRYLNDDLVTLK